MPQPIAPPLAAHAQRGGMLIEVLVAMFILALAVLGSIAMQMNAIANGREVHYHVSATAAAREMTELIANNPQGNYTLELLGSTATVPSIPSPNCISAKCNATQLAAWEVADWQHRLREHIPGAQAVVCRDTTATDTAGRLRWACANNADPKSPLWIKIGWPQRQTSHDATTGQSTSSIKNEFGDASGQLRPGIALPVMPLAALPVPTAPSTPSP